MNGVYLIRNSRRWQARRKPLFRGRDTTSPKPAMAVRNSRSDSLSNNELLLRQAMARIPRIVVPGLPHHVTQRGNRGRVLFACSTDYILYRDLIAERCRHFDIDVWAYCFMPNHVHLILVPAAADALARAIGEAHRRFTAFINARERVTGHLFQGRFYSVAIDERHLHSAFRYIAMNPVKAGLTNQAQDWPWSSTRAHLSGRDDSLVNVAPGLDRIGDFQAYLRADPDFHDEHRLDNPRANGRPLMSEAQLIAVEQLLGRRIRRLRLGPKSAD